MRMCVASDFHGTLEPVEAVKEFAMAEKVDCMVLTGDITNFGTVNLAYKIINDLAQTKAPVLYVPGNCDPPELANFEKEKVNGFCLHGRGTRVKNVAFIGVGGSPPTPFETPFEITEKEILEAVKLLAKEGIFLEPAGAASVAGAIKLVKEKKIDRDEKVICVLTGHGLKTPEIAIKMLEKPIEVAPKIEEIEKKLMTIFNG